MITRWFTPLTQFYRTRLGSATVEYAVMFALIVVIICGILTAGGETGGG